VAAKPTPGQLPPSPLPPLPDPVYGGEPGPYSVSPLREVVGSRVHKHALVYYSNRAACVEGRAQLTCAHPEIATWIGDVGSLDPRVGVPGRKKTAKRPGPGGEPEWMRIQQPPRSEWPFTTIIPRLPIRERMPFDLRPATYALDYAGLGVGPDSRMRDWVVNLKERFPEGSQLLLTFFGHTALKLGLWTDGEFWQQPFLDNFDAIVTPVFYGYSDDPIAQSLVGDRMQQIFASEGAAAGRNIIPSIAWTDERSLRNQVELWTSMFPRVNTIMIDAFGHGVKRELWNWRWIKAIRKYCAPHTEIRWIFAGLTPGYAVAALRADFPEGNFSLMTALTPFIHSLSSARPRELQGDDFQRKVKKMEAWALGLETPEAGSVEPDYMPDFGHYRVDR
jgi:hypothetical protein